MVYPKIYEKIANLKKEKEIFEIVFLYRYASLLITSILYMMGNQNHSYGKKIFIVGCITIASVLLHYLYIKNEASITKTKILILIETLGNSFILIPSGGINSPYVWYSLNTILITSVKLNNKYCWGNLFIYLFNSTIVTQFIVEDRRDFTGIFMEESNLLLSFVLITGIIQIPVKYAKKIQEKSYYLEESNRKLMMADAKNKEAMSYIMELYQGVHLFTIQQDKKDLIQLMVEYSKKMIKTTEVVFVEQVKKEKKISDEVYDAQRSMKDKITTEILKEWNHIISSDTPIEMKINDKTFVFIDIGCNYRTYGILGIDITYQRQESDYKETLEQLKFLASLSANSFEKLELEKINEKLLINEEQNRIANEIHDGILQRLFSISCNIFTSIKYLEKGSVKEITRELNKTRASLNSVMKDLRATIYSLSWRKDGTNNFIDNIESYIEEMKSLNNIYIDFHLEGNHEMMSMEQKKAVYRIICEGIGNAVRHGEANHIEVILTIEAYRIFLQIEDNGKGFDLRAVEKEGKMGLGIKNIQLLTQSLSGSISIDSQLALGTKIAITIPNALEKFYEEEVV
ncbi:Histidine kinase [Natronincola peptidivorans]|uniref:histidine kinase n=1 Tax=Natronincola peptidivorans TaxID=426128 RepID=A0A1H9ZYU5_9FIRM|nr:ATP-binding protein [Natronincola peptidivorans]SES86935.1 Histidine kinase [Natronincola peptidivorans]